MVIVVNVVNVTVNVVVVAVNVVVGLSFLDLDDFLFNFIFFL